MASILIIEDEKHIREFYGAVLGEKYSLSYAETGQEGFTKASEEDYDLIISDLLMPSWSGAETVATLDAVSPHNHFIIISGVLEDKEFQELLNTVPNIVDQLQKPISVDTLLDSVSRALHKHQQQSGSRPVEKKISPSVMPPQENQNKSSTESLSLETSQWVAMAGALMVAIGLFLPVMQSPSQQTLSYSDLGPNNVMIMGLLCVVSFVVAFTKGYSVLFIPGVSVLGVLGFEFINLQLKLSDLRSGLDNAFTDNPLLKLNTDALHVVQLQWGWFIMFVGALLILASPLYYLIGHKKKDESVFSVE